MYPAMSYDLAACNLIDGGRAECSNGKCPDSTLIAMIFPSSDLLVRIPLGSPELSYNRLVRRGQDTGVYFIVDNRDM